MFYLTIIFLFITQPTTNTMERYPSKKIVRNKSHESLTTINNQHANNFATTVNNSLFKAIQENNLIEVKTILNPNLNQEDENGNSLLNIAIRNKNEDMVKILLEKNNINVNKPNEWGNTPIHNAMILNLPYIIDLLLQHPGVDVTIKNKHNLLPYNYITSTETSFNIENVFKARTFVDTLVNKEIFPFQLNCQKDSITINNITKTILLQIRDKLANNLEYKPIINHILFYVNNDFISKMILARLKPGTSTVHKLK